MSPKPNSLDEYLATLNAAQRSTIQRLREAIIAAEPAAEPVFSYGIPGFELKGRPLAWVAAWQKHYSLYPLAAAATGALRDDVEGYEISKGTIRFPATEPVPIPLVRKLVQARAAELRGNA